MWIADCGLRIVDCGTEVPVGSLVAAFDVEGVLQDLHGERDDAVAQPVLDQRGGLLVREWIGARGACRLDVEFLEHLHREREVGVAQDRFGFLLFPASSAWVEMA